MEAGDDGVFDFVEVLDGLGLVDEQVGAIGVGAETPNFAGVGDVPVEIVREDTGAGFEVVTGPDSAAVDIAGELLGQGLRGHVETVVLVGGLGKSGYAGDTADSLTVGNDGVRNTEGNAGVVFFQILQANFQMQFTGTGDDVLARLGDEGQDARIGLGQTLETFDKLGQVVGILDFDGAPHDGGDGELHDLEVVGGLGGGEGTGLEQELVNTDQSENVTSGHILNWLDEAAHHENGSLDSLDEQIFLAARSVVRALDADLETGADGTREDTTESVEAALIGGRHHLGDVKHERSFGVAVTDTNAGLVVGRTFVQGLSAVFLGSDGGWEVEHHHFNKGIGSWQELLHDNLEQRLAFQVLLFASKLDLKLLDEGVDLILLGVGDGIEDLEDGVEDELVESTLKRLALVFTDLGPLLGLGVEVVVALHWISRNITRT